jgi:cardiolipin synthase
MHVASPWSTRANALTLARLLIAPALAAALLAHAPGRAAVLFFMAVATDLADGWVARHYGEVSPLGGFIDHAVDATFVVIATAALARLGVLPVLLPGAIAAAFLQYALDSRVLSASGLFPSRLGRWNGIAYYVIAAVPITRDGLGLAWPPPALVHALGWLLVVSTALSMLDRLRLLLRARNNS